MRLWDQAEPFTIHRLNNYSFVGLTALISHLELDALHIQRTIIASFQALVEELAQVGIDYARLRNALVPRKDRHEVAFVFDSTRANDVFSYGHSIAETWIPILKEHGPPLTTISVGDILRLPNRLVWEQLQLNLNGSNDFPRLSRELYFVVYVTNLSKNQRLRIDEALKSSSPAYLGFVDCTTWKPLKAGMFLPQVGLRAEGRIITSADDAGNWNVTGYPYEANGFTVVGIQEPLYNLFLVNSLDNGVPTWADEDSSVALTLLGGHQRAASETTITISKSRLEYLARDHKASIERAGIARLDPDDVAEAIERQLATGVIYNLRLIHGTQSGRTDRKLDALMYTMQLEFPNGRGGTDRYQLGLKYSPETHTSEVTTFF